jgi:hypothetical protein
MDTLSDSIGKDGFSKIESFTLPLRCPKLTITLPQDATEAKKQGNHTFFASERSTGQERQSIDCKENESCT